VPLVGCKQTSEQIIVNENQTFSIAIALVDFLTASVIRDISFNVTQLLIKLFKRNFTFKPFLLKQNQTWTGSIELEQLKNHQPDGHLATTAFNRTFNPATGLATFAALSLGLQGMYLLRVTAKSSDSFYNVSCLTRTVEVRRSTDVFASLATPFPPNYLVYFVNANRTEVQQDILRANVHNFMRNYSVKAAGTASGLFGDDHVVVSFYSDDVSEELEFALTRAWYWTMLL